MPIVTFEEVQNHKAKALRLFEDQRRLILSWEPAAEVMHVGSSAFDEGLSRGDLDIQVRVTAEQYPAARDAMAAHYAVNPDGYTSDDAASFKDDDLDPPVGVIITVIDGSGDALWRFRDALLARPDLAAAYSALKARFQGKSLADYRAAKHFFIRRVIRTAEYAALAQSLDWRFRPLRLETERLVLFNPQDGDAARIADYYARNADHLSPWEPPRPEGWTTEAYWADAIGEQLAETSRGQSLRLLWLERDAPDGDVVGIARLGNIVRGPFLACYLGFSVDGRHQGRGYGREALAPMIRFAFDDIGLHRIMANHVPENARSARLLASLGFTVEGRAADYLYVGGRWQDHVLTALTNPRPVTPQGA